MNVTHPDIIKFIDAKLKHGVLSCYNISVAVTDKFLEAVEADADWEYKFAHQSYGVIKARKIWNKIINNMVECAEPGLLNWDKLIKNNSYYYDPVLGTNPCGEAVLSPYDVCDLGSLVLPNFITGTINTNWKKLEETIKVAVRFLDDVIEVNKYVLHEIDIKAHNSRRIGLGVMGLAEYLFAKKLRYGSRKAIAEVERLMRFIRDVTYETLVELAQEKGAFPKFDPIPYGKASFIRKLPASLRMSIKKHGVRCVTALAIAPTGTISLVADVTSSIEPLIKKAYRRTDRIGERMYVHPIYLDHLQTGDPLPSWYVDSDDLDPSDHFEVQVAVQKFVDGAVSKTINMPAGTTPDQLSHLMLEYIHDLKGVTVYVDGSREGQILNSVSEEEVRNYLERNKVVTGAEAAQCATGMCDLM
jgi:ribonucleoside-diphosphate reductase alpha chain